MLLRQTARLARRQRDNSTITTSLSTMSSQPDDVASKLKSHLKVYEDLLRDQAAEIASLKAEVAYLKKQVLVESQNKGPAGKVNAAQVRTSLLIPIIITT